MASKFVGTNEGRKVISFYLGDAGTELVNSLENAASADIGPDKAKELISGIFKLSLKAKLLHDEKLITRDEYLDFTEPINSLAMMVYDTLRSDREEKVDLKKLSLKFAQLESMIVEMLRKHIKGRNVQLCSEIFKYFGGVKFLEKFLHSSELEEDRIIFTKNLHIAMRQRMEEEDMLPPPKKCAQAQCKKDAEPSDGIFCGSNCCAEHHREQYARLLKNPSIYHFLVENGKTYKPVLDIIEAEMPPQCPGFLRACHNYTTVKDNLRLIFAEELHSKYLGEKAKKSKKIDCVSGEEKKIILETVRKSREEKALPPIKLYDTAKEQVLKELEPIFLKTVVPSEAYKRYVKTRNMDYLPTSPKHSARSKGKPKSPKS